MAPRSNDLGRATGLSSELAADWLGGAADDGFADFLPGALPVCAATTAPRTRQSRDVLHNIVFLGISDFKNWKVYADFGGL
jgi:hypothetical protein